MFVAILPAALLTQLPILQVAIPLLAAPVCVLFRRGRWAHDFSLLVTAIASIISVALLQFVFNGGVISYALGGFAPPWGIEYRIDSANAVILLLVSVSGFLALLQSRASIETEIPEQKHPLFYTAFLLCLTGLLGVAATGDAFNAFVFLEISSLATYALVAMGKSPRALTAAFRYLILGTIGASTFVIGVGLLYMATGTLNMSDLATRIPASPHHAVIQAAFALIIVGLGLKAAIFPLHLWLPNVYTFAPAVVTTFLAATATKVALYLLARFVFVIFEDASFAGTLLMPLALLAMFLASLAALQQGNVKRILAYSSIAQIGYMLFALALASTQAVAAAWLLILTHALAKGGLFMAVAGIALQTGSSNLDDWKGIAKQMPWSAAVMVVCFLSLVGVPLTAGFVAKWSLLSAIFSTSESIMLAAVVAGVSLLTLLYAGKVLEIVYLGTPDEQNATANLREAPLAMLLVALLVAAMNIYFGFNGTMLSDLSKRAALALLSGF